MRQKNFREIFVIICVPNTLVREGLVQTKEQNLEHFPKTKKIKLKKKNSSGFSRVNLKKKNIFEELFFKIQI